MRRHSLSLTVAALALLATDLPAQKTTTLLDSYQRVRSLIDAAVAAHGGVDALRTARTARVRLSGWNYHPTQGRRITPPFDSTLRLVDVVVDLDRNRIAYTQTRGWPGGFHYTDRFVTKGDSSYYVAPRNQNYSVQQWPRADQQFNNLFAIPQWHLLAAYESNNPAARRYLGRMQLPGSGTEVEVVAFTVPPSGNIVIGLDSRTSQLRALMGIGFDVFTGDTEVVTEFFDWRMLDGQLLLPTRSVQRRGGHVIAEQRYVSAQANYQAPDSLFAVPAGFTVAPQNPPAEPVKELAPGVWLVGGGSKALVVAFNDHLVVVDAPTGGSADVINRAATLAPGKPIRYVVPTHHHDDHFAGVRHFAAKGATIVTTSGNIDYLRRVMTAPMSSVISSLNQVPPKSDYRVETISGGRRVFSDGTRTLEIHQIASPHAEEMLVGWLPSEGILFQADLIEASAGVALRGANAESTTHLAEGIRQKGWDVRLFTGAHSTLRAPTEFASLVRLPIIPPGQ